MKFVAVTRARVRRPFHRKPRTDVVCTACRKTIRKRMPLGEYVRIDHACKGGRPGGLVLRRVR